MTEPDSVEQPPEEQEEAVTYTAQIPSTKLEVEGDWPKGTILNINLSLRVRARTDGEDRKGNSTLHHMLVVEEAQILSVLTPAQRKAMFEAAEAAEKAKQNKVIEEEPGREDQAEELGEDPAELVNELAPAPDEDWSDVEAKDAEKRALQVESAEPVEESDEHRFDEIPEGVGF